MPRRHDLDALRGIAMLMGIALHGALSFTPLPWPVKDSRQEELFALFLAAVHGFRMPLFFLLSGFFTAMLWRRRGLKALIRHRFRRVFLPCMLGLVTIVPAVNLVVLAAVITAPKAAADESPAENTLSRRAIPESSNRKEEPQDHELGRPGQTFWRVAVLLCYAPVFHHLWFLWYLCWLVAAFALFAVIADQQKWAGPPRWLILGPVRFLWLLPLTMIPQSMMGLLLPELSGFGPDTSTGLVPAPHIFFYYAIFFGFGALYFDCDDQNGRVGRWWPLGLALGVLVVFPLGLEFSLGSFGLRERLADPAIHRLLAVVLQVLYTWMMTFGLMGLFRQLLVRENKTLRYLSDSSYWLYLAHLPLIFSSQAIVRSWPLPAIVKFSLICTVVTAFLLYTYQTLVRYTWLGTMLNGPRKRPERAISAEVVSE
jgi:peptidoglycan/LPS O-acetylase OafA/YrhL